MNSIDASDHYSKEASEPPVSLLNIIIDTNPRAWASLEPTLSLADAISALLVFINAHLAFNHANQVAIFASHVDHAERLYPVPEASTAKTVANDQGTSNKSKNSHDEKRSKEPLDIEMPDAPITNGAAAASSTSTDAANFYRPFAAVASVLRNSLAQLIAETKPSDLTVPPSTCLAGALTLALAYTNKVMLAIAPPASATGSNLAQATSMPSTSARETSSLVSRVLVLSMTPAPPSQYIPLMNTIFAAQRLRIPIDVLAMNPTPEDVRAAISATAPPSSRSQPDAQASSTSTETGASSTSTSSPFLQQAATTTAGIYLPLVHPHGLLQTLMQAFLASPPSRDYLIPPAALGVDFRAACFCHRRVVDIGFVCSVCLSIFCEPPEGAACWTCGTHLRLQDYGAKPIVVATAAQTSSAFAAAKAAKKKKRRREDGGTPAPASAAATPANPT